MDRLGTAWRGFQSDRVQDASARPDDYAGLSYHGSCKGLSAVLLAKSRRPVSRDHTLCGSVLLFFLHDGAPDKVRPTSVPAHSG
jgi:hypothetical protein